MQKLKKDIRTQVNTDNSNIILSTSKFSLSWWMFTNYHDDYYDDKCFMIILIIKTTGS